MSVPEVRTIASPALRGLRMRRAVTRWVEQGGDLDDVPLDVVLVAVGEGAEQRGRDLDAGEVEAVVRAAIASYVAGREQREAERAISSAREEEAERARLEYLRRRQAEYRLTAEERIIPPRGQR